MKKVTEICTFFCGYFSDRELRGFEKKSVTSPSKKRYLYKVKNFKKFYRKNKDRLFGYLLRRTGDYSLAADIMQESFTKYLERYRDRELSVSLLFTIGRNLLYDNARKQRGNTLFEEDRHESSVDQEHTVLVREESRRVLVALRKLNKDDADILGLAVTSGLSYREIAGITGVSESNVKVKIHRSRLKLKKILRTGVS